MNKLTIGQMAEINQVSEQTLRYYDKLGILKPQKVNKETGYRYYSIKQSARIDMIQYLKSLGMSLNDIAEQINHCNTKMIINILEHKNNLVNEQIATLKHQSIAIERAIKNYQRYDTSPPEGAIALEFIGERFIYSNKTDINFYNSGIEAYEELLRLLKDDLEQKGLRQFYFCNAGNTVTKENVVRGEFISNELFVFVDPEYFHRKHITTVTAIPENTYLCIYCNRFDKEISYANKLLDEIKLRDYTITGDYICEVIADLLDYNDSERGMFFRLQIPVKFN